MISLKIEIAFAADVDKIRLPIAEVLLHTAAGDLARSNKQRDWTPCNTVLLPPFLTEASILHGESDTGNLLKVFYCSITEWEKDEDSTSEADEANDDDSVVTIDAKEAKANPGKAKQASAETAAAEKLTTITDNFNDVLAFLQAISVKSPRVIAAPLYLRAEKGAHVCFQSWTYVNLPNPPKPSPQDHLGLTGVLTDVATLLHMTEALRPVVAAHCEAEK